MKLYIYILLSFSLFLGCQDAKVENQNTSQKTEKAGSQKGKKNNKKKGPNKGKKKKNKKNKNRNSKGAEIDLANNKKIDDAAEKALAEMDISDENRLQLDGTFDRYKRQRADILIGKHGDAQKNKSLRILNEQQTKYIRKILGEQQFKTFQIKFAKYFEG